MTELLERFEQLENQIICSQKAVLNIGEVCTLTGLSKSTIYKLTMNGKIPHYKQAKHLYFDRVEIENWLKANRGFDIDEVEAQASSALTLKKKRQSNEN
jgi:excisionase family DNA binding protein